MGLLAVVAAVCFSLQSIAMRYIKAGGLRQTLLTTGTMSALIAVSFWGLGLVQGLHFSAFSLGLGALLGAVYVFTIMVYYNAMQIGPLALTSFFLASSMLVPALGGIILWREPFVWSVGLGIILFLAAFYLISVPDRKHETRPSGKWLLLCLMTWLGNGCFSLIIKGHQMTMAGQEANELLVAGFSSAALLAFLLYALSAWRSGLAGDKQLIKTAAPLLLLAAAGNGTGNILVTYLSSRLSGAYLFPMVQGGALLLLTLYSAFILREKLGRSGTAGILFSVAAILAMNL